MESTNNKTHASSYRPEIDGLRAIAVIAVLINHLEASVIPSGFLGVDIFFVISGFVVTSSLSNKPDQSWKSFLSTFYSRRVKRLFPALVTCVVITSILGCFFIFDPGNSLKTGISALLGLSNIFLFADSTDYFGQSAEFNLFTQTWSLGVEEQFYLLFPILIGLCGFSRKRRKNGERNLLITVLFFGTVSLIAYLYLAFNTPSAAFFLMPARFWELGLGCITFLFLRRVSKPFPEFLAPLFTLIIIGLLFVSKDLQILSTVSTAFVTAALLFTFNAKSSLVKLLSSKGFMTIGKLSYSLYLWHWSVIVLFRWTLGVSLWTIPLQVLLMTGLALGSYHLIEQPLRYLNWSTSKLKTIAYGLGTSLTSVFLLAGLGNPFQGKFYSGNAFPDASRVSFDLSKEFEFCWFELSEAPNFGDCAYPSANQSSPIPKTIYFVGDSHNKSLQAVASQLISDQAIPRIVMVVQHACLFSPTLVREENSFVDPIKCRESVRSFLSEVLKVGNEGDVVVVTNRYKPIFLYANYPAGDSNYTLLRDDVKLSQAEALNAYSDELAGIAETLSEKKMSLVVQAPLPDWKHLPQECDEQWFRLAPPSTCDLSANSEAQVRKPILDAFLQAEKKASNLHIYDPFSLFCNSENCSQFAKDGTPLFSDDNHLNNYGAEFLYDEFRGFLQQRSLI